MSGTLGMPVAGQPLTGAWRWIAFIAMLFGNFIAILDIQVVASSLNEIQAGLSATTEEASWLQTSYLIAEVIAIPLAGYLSRLLSTRIYFVLSALGFTLASLACAMSTSLEQMIVFRAIQGFTGGGMIPTTFAVMFMLFEPHERTWATVCLGLVATLAPSIGPTIGGYLTGIGSWHWIFLINLVPGVVVAAAVWRLIHVDEADWSLARRLDWAGLVSLALFLGGLQYVLEEGPRNDWFDDSHVTFTALVAAAAAVLFFYRVFTYAEPLVTFAPLRDRNFVLSTFSGFMLGVALYGSTFLIPLFLGQVRQYTAAQIGSVMIVTGMSMFTAAPIAGALSKFIDNRLILALGICLITLSMYMNGHLTADSSYAELFVPQMLRGAGILFCMVPMTELAMATLPPQLVHGSSGLFNLSRNLGGAFGLAYLNTLLIEHSRLRGAQLRESLDPHGWHVPELMSMMEGMDNLPAGVSSEQAALKMLTQMVDQQALVMAFNDAMLACVVPYALSIVVLLFMKPSNSAAPAPLH